LKTVGFFSPLPPAKTGVADYSASLLAALRKYGPVEIARGAVALYHVGNNHLHREIYQLALTHPGITVLHDAVLQHFFLGTLDESAYVDEFVYNYGEWMRDLARELWRNRARSAADPRYFDYPMLKRIATQSSAVIVHNPAAARVVKQHAPHARIFEIPHLFDRPPQLPDAAEIFELRAALGLAPGELLVGVFGHLRESKRLPVVIRAMERSWSEGTNAKLLIAGSFASTDLERAITPLLANPKIARIGYLSERDFWRYASATDLCVNLRYPTAAESSGIAIRMMGIGKTVAFSEGEEIARIPENACLRIPRGAAEEQTLAAMIVWLASEPEAAIEIGRRAARHIACEHAIDRVAKLYLDAINTA
jgi:glycosyltransferase involved in cell wall biosynthesis